MLLRQGCRVKLPLTKLMVLETKILKLFLVCVTINLSIIHLEVIVLKKPDKRENANLFLSAFLIIAFIICAHFFTQFTANLDATVAQLINIAIYVVFGLLMFYATRVSEGKPVIRFSVITLIVLVIPSLYIIIASIAKFMPLNSIFAADANGTVSVITALAAVAFGYGIPYTFLSGFELEPEFEGEVQPEVLDGGVEADILESADETVEETVESDVETVEQTDEQDAEEIAE